MEVQPLLLINDGGFQAPVELTVNGPQPLATTGDIAVGDFDSVPGHDVVMHGSRVFASDGSAGLISVQSVGSTMGGFAAAGRFDSEAPGDLAIAEVTDFGRGTATLSIALGTKQYFGDALDLAADCEECTARDEMSVADVNNDDHDDIVYPSTHGISILLGCGDGTFAGPLLIEFGESLQRVMVGKLDDDEWPDLLTTDTNATKLYVLLGQGGSG